MPVSISMPNPWLKSIGKLSWGDVNQIDIRTEVCVFLLPVELRFRQVPIDVVPLRLFGAELFEKRSIGLESARTFQRFVGVALGVVPPKPSTSWL